MRLLLDALTGELIDRPHIRLEFLLCRRVKRRAVDGAERTHELGACLLCTHIVLLFRIDAHGKVELCAQGLLERLMREVAASNVVEQRLPRLLDDRFAEGFFHAVRHGIVKGVDALPAEHVVLVRLNRDAREARVGADGVRLAQEAVPRREAAAKELEEVDLAAVERDEREVLVVDVDEVLAVGRRIALLEDVVVDEVLRALRAEFQHDAHRRVRVDVRVVALEVGVHRIGKEDVAVALHEVLLRETPLGVALAVGDVAARDVVVSVREQLLFDEVLDLLDADLRTVAERLLDTLRHRVDLERRHRVDVLLARRCNGIEDLRPVIGHGMTRTFCHRRHCHRFCSFILYLVVCVFRYGRYCNRGEGCWQGDFSI